MLAFRAYRLWIRVRNKLFTTAVGSGFGKLGSGVSLQLPIDLLGIEKIELGDAVLIQPGCILNSHLGGTIRIGHRAMLFERVTITSQADVVIGEAVMISRNVHISDHDHRFSEAGSPVMDQGMTDPRPISIGDGAWIGHGAVLMPGVKIGRGAVVGANSIVNVDVPDYSLAVGVPARVIRTFGTTTAADHQMISEA